MMQKRVEDEDMSKVREDKGKCYRDKAVGNISRYIEKGFGLTVDFKQDEETHANFVTGWKIYSQYYTAEGTTTIELLEELDKLKALFNLRTYKNGEKKFVFKGQDCQVVDKDVLVLYTNSFWELECFMYPYLTNVFEDYYFQVLDNIEIRECWENDLTTADKIAEWANGIIEELFIPDRYFYLTPAQIMKKRIEKTTKRSNETMATDVFPKTNSEYDFVKEALFGGLCYCPYAGEVFEEPICEWDLGSAYIYAFLMPHAISEGEWVDNKLWEMYLHSDKYLSIGTYKIKFSGWSKKITCFKNSKGENIKPEGITTDEFTFTNIDLDIFIKSVNVISIECKDLMRFEAGYLPKCVLDDVIDAYINKNNAVRGTTAYLIAKIILNAIYGNTIRKLTAEERCECKEFASLAPQWGIFITSYIHRMIIEVGNKISGWVYSDTDSIWGFDTRENQAIIDDYNAITRNTLKIVCEDLGYDFESLKHLGEFKIETKAIKFRALKQKQYVFTKPNGEIFLTASGICKTKTEELDDTVYECKRLTCGNKVVRKRAIHEPVDTIMNGVKLHEESSFYKKMGKGYVADCEIAVENRAIDELDNL